MIIVKRDLSHIFSNWYIFSNLIFVSLPWFRGLELLKVDFCISSSKFLSTNVNQLELTWIRTCTLPNGFFSLLKDLQWLSDVNIIFLWSLVDSRFIGNYTTFLFLLYMYMLDVILILFLITMECQTFDNKKVTKGFHTIKTASNI